jgi:hypothetical protein
MALSLWERLDSAFAAAFAGEMGIGGAYTSLTLRDVQVNETWNPDREPWPRLILYSTSARVGESEHGGGGVRRLDVTYPYLAVAIATGDSYATARADAQELFERMLAVLAKGGPILAAAMAAAPTSSAQATRIRFERGGASGIEVRGRQGSNGGRHLGVAIVAWTVETKTGV